jgi:hypothetical protein
MLVVLVPTVVLNVEKNSCVSPKALLPILTRQSCSIRLVAHCACAVTGKAQTIQLMKRSTRTLRIRINAA